MKRYHDDFPAAPAALISGIAACCVIPSIIGARVGTSDGSIFLDVYQDDNFHLTVEHLNDLAEFCCVDVSEVEIENGPDVDSVTVTVTATGFDFSDLADDLGPCPVTCEGHLSGSEDSEESVEAHASTLNRRV